MSLTDADLDRCCKHCNRPLREHATLAEGAWFVTPCDAWLRSTIPETWDLMVLDDGFTCRFCCQLMRSHFVVGTLSVRVQVGASITEIVGRSPNVGEIVALLPQAWTDCRTDEQRAWVPPPPPKCHADGSPFGFRNPWATG